MSAVATERSPASAGQGSFHSSGWLSWFWLAAGLAAMFATAAWRMLVEASHDDRNIHTPILLTSAAIVLFRELRGQTPDSLPHPRRWLVLVVLGMACYMLGNSQNIPLLEVGSLPPLLAGIIASLLGTPALIRLRPVFLLLVLALPLPAFIVDGTTQPLKILVSHLAETLLYRLGYPVALDGVVLGIGQYRLLVSDACSGMRSLFVLEALGLFYLHLRRTPSFAQVLSFGALVVPLAIAANVIRVVTLALVTYHFGDAAGQGFLHELSGLLLFGVALSLLIGIDALLSRRRARRSRTEPAAPVRGRWPALPKRPAAAFGAAMLLAAIGTRAMAPRQEPSPAWPPLAAAIPSRIGLWRAMPAPATQIPPVTGVAARRDTDQPYDDVLLRAYSDGAEKPLMLALAHAGRQRQDVKIHSPETCYTAQGFQLLDQSDAMIPMRSRDVPGRRLLFRNRDRIEAVTYWIRIGDEYPRGSLAMRYKLLRDGLAGSAPDGMLVRVSSLLGSEREADAAYALHDRFLAALTDTARRTAPELLLQ